MSNVGADLHALARRVSRMPKEMVREGAKELKQPLLRAVVRDSGGDRRLSGLQNSQRFGVSTSVRGTDVVKGRVYAGPPGMRGPWSWLNQGTRPRRQGRGQHPGTPAKRTWDETAQREVSRVMRAMVARWDRGRI